MIIITCHNVMPYSFDRDPCTFYYISLLIFYDAFDTTMSLRKNTTTQIIYQRKFHTQNL